MLFYKKTINTLIIDDHPIISKAYSNILKSSTGLDFVFKFAINCDESIKELKRSPKDLILLDLQLPASEDKKFISGEDIGLWLRQHHPKTKILILTAISDSERIRSIIKTINPEGFIIKSEMDSKDLIIAAKTILKDKRYYGQTIKNYNNNNNNNIEGQIINDIDRKILYHLSMGETNNVIANLVCISKRTVEARKAKLKDILNILKDSDSNLIKEAKRRNII